MITQNGDTSMMIRSVADVEQTQETLALLKMLTHSQQAVAEGRTVSVDYAFQQLRQHRAL